MRLMQIVSSSSISYYRKFQNSKLNKNPAKQDSPLIQRRLLHRNQKVSMQQPFSVRISPNHYRTNRPSRNADADHLSLHPNCVSAVLLMFV